MSVLETTAKAIFDSLGGLECKADWDKQPESVKEVFRKKAAPGSFNHHYGANLVWMVRGNGTPVIYKSMTGSHRLKRDWEIKKGSKHG